MAKLLVFPRFKAFKDDNSPAVGWKLYSYLSGTTTPHDTYADQSGAVANANPVVLDGSGEADVWLDPAYSYKFVLKDENDAVQRTVDLVQVPDLEKFSAISVSGQIESTVATGTAPLKVASTTKVVGLNADLLDGGDWGSPGAIGSDNLNTGSFSALHAFSDFTSEANVIKKAGDYQQSANGAQCVNEQISEEITLSTVGTTTDSVANLLPANSVIKAIVARVTQSITTATDWKLGDATQAARFLAAQSGAQLIAGATAGGFAHLDPTVASANLGPVQSAAAKLRITTTGTPGAGKIRVTVFYTQYVFPTS